MVVTFLYIFAFSTWALGLLSWIVFIGQKLQQWDLNSQEKTLDIKQKQIIFNKFNSLTPGAGISGSVIPDSIKQAPWGSVASTEPMSKDSIPEKIRELMKSSPNHPEVEEIDSGDQILGVRFEAENYPPGFDGDEDE
jgi:cytoskeletal protein RodZ